MKRIKKTGGNRSKNTLVTPYWVLVSRPFSAFEKEGFEVAGWVELRRLLSESQSSSSERRGTHGKPKVNSWRFFEGSSTFAIVLRQQPAPGQVMTASLTTTWAGRIFFASLSICQDRTTTYRVTTCATATTFSCCLARVAIPCQVQQPELETAPPIGSKRSFFPLFFLPLPIEEKR